MRQGLVCSVALLASLATACSSPQPRLNAPPHGVAEEVSNMQSMYSHMVDNALLTDMTISDMHFLPHRAILSTLGEQRLSRLASLMQTYGGVIRFNTDQQDQDLIDARLETVLAFLREAGVDTSTEVVRRDLAGGTGMEAREAILIKVNEATYKPSDEREEPSGSMRE
jgi:hypothetical protein